MLTAIFQWVLGFRKPVLYPAELRARRLYWGFCNRPIIFPRLLCGVIGGESSLTSSLPYLTVPLLLVACSSPTAPTSSVISQTEASAASPSLASTGATSPVPAAVDASPCPVSTDDIDHARRLLRQLTYELERNVEMRFSLVEYSAPYQPSGRELHGYLNYGTAGPTWMIVEGSLAPKTLKFGSAQAAGFALWEAAGQLTITADIYVSGVKVQGCTPRVGKITGRIDLDGL